MAGEAQAQPPLPINAHDLAPERIRVMHRLDRWEKQSTLTLKKAISS